MEQGAPGKKLEASLAVNVREDAAGTYCLRFSPDGQQLALACGDGSIELRNPDPASKDPIKFLVGGTGEQVPVTAMKYPTNETLTAAGTNGFISFWACKTGKLIDFFREEQNEIYALDYSHERSMFATGGNDKAVRVYDAATNQQMHMYNEKRGEGDIDHVYCLKFHGERRDILVGAGWTRQVRVWDVRVPGVVREIYGPKICGEGLDIDGDTILTSSWLRDDAVQMWDLRFANREPEVLPTPTPNGAYFYCGMFVPHHDLIGCGGSGTHDARLYNRKTHELVGTIECTHPKTKKPKPVQAMDFSADGKLMAMGGFTPTVKVVQLNMSKGKLLKTKGSISEFKLGAPIPSEALEG